MKVIEDALNAQYTRVTFDELRKGDEVIWNEVVEEGYENVAQGTLVAESGRMWETTNQCGDLYDDVEYIYLVNRPAKKLPTEEGSVLAWLDTGTGKRPGPWVLDEGVWFKGFIGEYASSIKDFALGKVVEVDDV